MTTEKNTAARTAPSFATRIVHGEDDLRAAQRLRYDVFVVELGGVGPLVDHEARLERDEFDPYADHILLLDKARAEGDQVVGVYRVMTAQMAQSAGRFYCAEEYDLSPFLQSGKRLLELGRSCLHPDYRGGPGMMHLWSTLAAYVDAHQIDILFGVASFHGTDVAKLSGALSLLHHRHLAPKALRVKAIGQTALSMDMIRPEALDRVAAVKQLPALIKAYLRLGATVGEGAFVDHAFNTVDICIILESDAIDSLHKMMLHKGAPRG